MIAWRSVVKGTVVLVELFRVDMADMFGSEYSRMILKMIVIIVIFGHLQVYNVYSC